MYASQSKANGVTQGGQLISKIKAELLWAGLQPTISGFHDQYTNPPEPLRDAAPSIVAQLVTGAWSDQVASCAITRYVLCVCFSQPGRRGSTKHDCNLMWHHQNASESYYFTLKGKMYSSTACTIYTALRSHASLELWQGCMSSMVIRTLKANSNKSDHDLQVALYKLDIQSSLSQ